MSSDEKNYRMIKGIVGRMLILGVGMLFLHLFELIALLDVSASFDFTGLTEVEQQ